MIYGHIWSRLIFTKVDTLSHQNAVEEIKMKLMWMMNCGVSAFKFSVLMIMNRDLQDVWGKNVSKSKWNKKRNYTLIQLEDTCSLVSGKN